MRIHIIAVGRSKGGPEAALVTDYRERFVALGRRLGIDELSVIELEDKKGGPGRQEREGALILSRVPAGAALVALDERGEMWTSEDFAKRLRTDLNRGSRDLAFVIGGAEGLSRDVLARADRQVAFGRATWPHLFARAMLAEQLYRAVTILTGHPYHRA